MSVELPIGMALLSSLMFALSFVFVRVGVRTTSPMAALWLTLSVNVVLLWSWSLLVYGWQFGHWWEWRYFLFAGIFAPLLGRLFQFQGMAKLGANITTPLTLTHPVVTVALAILFIGEEISSLGLLGALMVVLGSAVVGAQGGTNSHRRLQNVSPVYLLLPLMASLFYGISVFFRKIGIDIGSDAITASAVTCTSSWFFSSLYVFFNGAVGKIRCSWRELGFLVLAGIFSSLGPVLLYAALQFEDLVVIAPLGATTPLFVLAVSYVFIRADEIFTPKVIAGTFLTVAGVILVTTYGLV